MKKSQIIFCSFVSHKPIYNLSPSSLQNSYYYGISYSLSPLKSFYSSEAIRTRNINTLFDDNELQLCLPPLSINEVSEDGRCKSNPEFIYQVVYTLKELDYSYSYKFEWSLFLHTNDKDKNLTFHLLPQSGQAPDPQDMLKLMLSMKILYDTYKYRGYYVYHSEIVNFNFVKDFSDYLQKTYSLLGSIVINTNENLDEDNFIEFKKPTILNIKRIKY